MKLKHLLAVSCALYGSSVFAEQKPSSILTELAAPAAATQVTAEQRIAAFPSLADIPKDVAVVATVADFRQMASALMAQPFVAPLLAESGKTPAEILAEIPHVTSCTLAVSPEINELMLAYNMVSNAMMSETVFEGWSQEAADPVAIKAIGKALADQLLRGAQIEIPSFYLCASFGKDSAHLKQLDEMWLTTIKQIFSQATPEDLQKTGLTQQQIEGGVVIGVNVSFLLESAYGEMKDIPEGMQETIKMMTDSIKGKKVYIAYSRKGDRLRFALTDDISKPVFPLAPADSVAASSILDFSNQELSKNPLYIASGSMDPKTVAACYEPMKKLGGAIASVFTSAAAKDASTKPIMDAGAASVGKIMDGYIAFTESLTSNSIDVVVWADGNLNLEMYTQPGAKSQPGKLVSLPQVDLPSTLAYAEAAGGTNINCTMTLDEFIDHTTNITEAVLLTLNGDARKVGMPAVQVSKTFIPDAKQLLGNLGTAASGMGAPYGVLVDTKGSTMNFVSDKSPQMSIPRLAVFASVKDRAKIAKGWDDAKNTAKAVLTKVGQDAAMVDLVATTESQQDGVTLHMPSMPIFPNDAKPTIALTDKFWMLGSSPAYNVELQKALQASAGIPFTGSVMAVKVAPLNELAQKMSADVGTESSDGRDFAKFAQGMQFVNQYFNGVYATGTVEGNKQVLRVRVQMKK